MRPVKIMADSTADLSPELCKKYGISILPLYVTLDGVTMRDMIEVTPDDIFAAYRKNRSLPKTAAVTEHDYLESFRPWVGKGYDIIHFCISSDLSSCFQNAMIAASELEHVYVIDSRNLSAGIGVQAIEAAKMAEKGNCAEVIVDYINDFKYRVDASFIVGNLEYLFKGGRCSAVEALGANILGIKPCIEVADGKMRVGKKYRGSFSKCIESFIKDRVNGGEGIDTSITMFACVGCDPDTVKAARKEISKCAPFEEVLFTDIGTTIAGHCGPETFGMLVIHK